MFYLRICHIPGVQAHLLKGHEPPEGPHPTSYRTLVPLQSPGLALNAAVAANVGQGIGKHTDLPLNPDVLSMPVLGPLCCAAPYSYLRTYHV